MLDGDTERELYQAYRQFFTRAERERRWNLWADVPWDQANPRASDALANAVLAAYAEENFLPDYSEQLLNLLRASRGRAWFVTRWMYEEGKHSLALGEWLVRAGKMTDEQVRDHADDLLARTRRTLVSDEPLAAMVEAFAREQDEIARYSALGALAREESDGALAHVCAQLLSDEETHAVFFRDALRLIAARQPDLVQNAVETIAAAPAWERLAPRLRAELGTA